MATASMGLEPGLSEPAVISAVTVEIVANCRVKLTDVKIYLEANHAANRGTGIPAADAALAPVKAIHGKHFSSATRSSFVVSERCSWINVRSPVWATLVFCA